MVNRVLVAVRKVIDYRTACSDASNKGASITSEDRQLQETARAALRRAQRFVSRSWLEAYWRAHRHSLWAITIRGLAVLFGFVITFTIGRNFGPLANGQYALVTQTGLFLSLLAVGGMDQAIVRNFPAALVHRVSIHWRSLARALGYSTVGSLILAVALLLWGEGLFHWLFGPHLPADAVVLTSLILISRAVGRACAAVLRSQDAHISAQVIETLAIPLAVSTMIALQLIQDVVAVLWATAIIGLLVAGLGLIKALSYAGSATTAIDVPMRRLFSTSLPLWLTSLSLYLADWYGLAVAAQTLGVYEAGLFRVAYQIGSALAFVSMGLFAVFAARISAALVLGDKRRVARLSRSAALLASALLLLPAIALGIFAEPLLGLIGPEFRQASTILVIVLVGQYINVVIGPAGLILAMSGYERFNLAISASVTGALLLIAPLAATYFGLLGLGVAMAVIPVLGNIASFVAVYRLERINALLGTYNGPDGNGSIDA